MYGVFVKEYFPLHAEEITKYRECNDTIFVPLQNLLVGKWIICFLIQELLRTFSFWEKGLHKVDIEISVITKGKTKNKNITSCRPVIIVPVCWQFQQPIFYTLISALVRALQHSSQSLLLTFVGHFWNHFPFFLLSRWRHWQFLWLVTDSKLRLSTAREIQEMTPGHPRAPLK